MRKTNTVGIRMDDSTLQRLDALLVAKKRSATLRLLLMYVDPSFGKTGARRDFLNWVRSLESQPSF